MTGPAGPGAGAPPPGSGEPPRACERCLRRGELLAALAPRIEKVTANLPGSRSDEMLALSDPELAAALGTTVADALAGTDRGGSRRGRSARPGAANGPRAGAAPGPGGLPVRPPPTRPGRWQPAPAWSVCRHTGHLPERLDHLGGGAPRALFGLGDPARLGGLASEPAVTIVGARRATGYGKAVAHELGLLLAGAGITVVSGLAFGIDSASHRGALDGGGFTVAVLGGGADVPSPQGLAGLYRRVVDAGLVLSEMPPGFRPFRWSFPARNRIMAALGGATVVVEAAARSGSLITVRIAQSLGRDVGAVPGPITSRQSRGANALLRDGAFPVLGAEDVIEQLLGPGAERPEPRRPDVDERLQPILAAVEAGATTPDAIARATSLAPGEVATGLTRLELLGHVRADSTGCYVASSADDRAR